MRTAIPPRPVGNTPEAFFHQRVWDATFGAEAQFLDSDTVRVEHSTRGITLRAEPMLAIRPSLSMFRLKSVPAWSAQQPSNYVVARTYDGTTEGDTDIYIAKNVETRQPASETIAGELWNYTYGTGADANNQYRTAVYGSGGSQISESQVVTPYWICDTTSSSIIFAARAGATGVIKDEGEETEERLTWLLITSRCWAKRA